jgi:anti-sigma-K factor RskA
VAECEEIGQLLDAYALGAVEPQDVEPIEEHMTECLACWDHLTEAQKSAALLALAVPLEEPREELRQRILAQAQAEMGDVRKSGNLSSIGRRAMPLGLGVLAAGAVAALAWAFVLQNQTEDLRGDYRSLQQQSVASQQMLSSQRELTSLMLSDDIQTTELKASGMAFGSMAHYLWSPDSHIGAVICDKLPPAPEEMTYQLWFFYDGEIVDGGTFEVVDGLSQHTVDLDKLPAPPLSIGVTLEPLGGSSQPTGDLILTASLPDWQQ